jgi:uncharacterized protein YoaH (UPF0181 family)
MTTETRKKLLERIKAILAKTMANGCTEGEAMAALAKARELMATYEIDEKELQEFDREKTTTFKTENRDPYEIKRNLCVNVGKFTRCKAYRDRENVINFAGKESDIVFASWLLDTLQMFVMRELRAYQKKLITEKGIGHSNNLTSASFVAGCADRINEKLKELAPLDWAKTQELIVSELGMQLTKSRGRSRNISEKDAAAGFKAGEHARFDRPVGSDGKGRLLK